MSEQFKIGDLVQLKSGGPVMTVQKDYTDGDVHCQWFSGKKLEKGTFHRDTLVRQAEKPSS